MGRSGCGSLYWQRCQTQEEARKSFEEWLLPGYREGRGLYLLLHKETGFPLGHAGIVQQTVDGKKEFEIGYWLAKKYWGQGFAVEAAGFFKHYASEELGLQRLICLIQRNNINSIKVAKKLGMTLQKETTFNTIPCFLNPDKFKCLTSSLIIEPLSFES